MFLISRWYEKPWFPRLLITKTKQKKKHRLPKENITVYGLITEKFVIFLLAFTLKTCGNFDAFAPVSYLGFGVRFSKEIYIRRRCNWVYETYLPFWYLTKSIYSPNGIQSRQTRACNYFYEIPSLRSFFNLFYRKF